MRPTTISAAALLAGSAVAADDSCVKGLHVIVGRGTGEAAGTGVTGVLAEKIAKKIGNSDVVPVDYPASLSEPIYFDSVNDGTNALIKEVTSYAKKCPGAKMAYMGYSQGAQIASMAFCGGQGGSFEENDPIPSDAVKNVVAITLFGDPSHSKDFSYNQGTSDKDGIFFRESEGACSKIATKIVSYCDTGDVYCDAGDNSTVHGLYLFRYGDKIEDFIVSNYNNAIKGDGSNSTTTSAGSSMTATPTPTGGMGGNSTMITTQKPPTATGGNNGGDNGEGGDNGDGGSNGGSNGGSQTSGSQPPESTGAAAGLAVNCFFAALPLAMIATAQMLL